MKRILPKNNHIALFCQSFLVTNYGKGMARRGIALADSGVTMEMLERIGRACGEGDL